MVTCTYGSRDIGCRFDYNRARLSARFVTMIQMERSTVRHIVEYLHGPNAILLLSLSLFLSIYLVVLRTWSPTFSSSRPSFQERGAPAASFDYTGDSVRSIQSSTCWKLFARIHCTCLLKKLSPYYCCDLQLYFPAISACLPSTSTLDNGTIQTDRFFHFSLAWFHQWWA